ncbi:hypothetical protein [Futiania mangrovi]|uniref:Uncharacterized protein n=1 Tax=Futiania mangrovi TaxID=2959716 RepID=A0A9J6PM57_9PROT|nr:hypothetical protein [Futiania mangrovii]MCP1337130.1 hypothetical protein [Futiania mangrovii]
MSERDSARLDQLRATMEVALSRLEAARPFAKQRFQQPVLDVAYRMLTLPDGPDALYALAPRLDAAGLFAGSDWDMPATLQPRIVKYTLQSDHAAAVMLEVASLLRMLAVARGDAEHSGIHADHARHFLTQVLALNLDRFFGQTDEAARRRDSVREASLDCLFRYLAAHIGFQDVLGLLVAEIWRILGQRPVQVGLVKDMIAQIAVSALERGNELGEARLGADRLVSALFAPTAGCREDPGLETYRARLGAMDDTALRHEAQGFARAMHDTGLVSDYHAAFLRWAVEQENGALVPDALGLGSTGLECWRQYGALVEGLIAEAVTPWTAQSVYGLAMLLERGTLHHAPIAPALQRQMALKLCPAACANLQAAFGAQVAPETFLLAGVLQVLGQPLGVGQGANPSCQSARALSMWALNAPDYLLHLVAQAATYDTLQMHFEGHPINSADLPAGLVSGAPLDADAVSVILVPHLDRIYAEMGRRCADRGDDPHRWINPEFHGWWVGRECLVIVDVPSGGLADVHGFVRRFYRTYHPEYNGQEPVIHPQPAGIAVTDASARFVGWHAISILRVAEDQAGVMRVYFYNPNNDSGQDWGAGLVVSTQGMGERHGEASLPFPDFAARLYLFHYDPVLRTQSRKEPPPEAVAGVVDAIRSSWAAGRPDVDDDVLRAAAAPASP